MEIIALLYIVTCILSILSSTLLNYLIEIQKLKILKSDAVSVWAISLIPLLNVFVLIITSIIIIHTITKDFIEQNKQNKTKCDLYIHYKNNKLYKIVGLCKIQENNIWVDAIKYSSLNSKDIYVRSKSEFFEKFKLKENL